MEQKLHLSDGRALSYIVSAAPDGIPLIFHHGTPGSNAILPAFEAACKGKGIKLIRTNRAGYSTSTRCKGRRVVDVVDDIQQLIDHLKITKFLVAGWSGGGRFSSCLHNSKISANYTFRTACAGMCSAIAWVLGCAVNRQHRPFRRR